jgi:hypothetical protein
VPEPEGFTATFVSLYRQIHDQLREEISELDTEALGWLPGPETNSISTIVVHLLGSGHAREHLAHLQLTKQLLLQRPSAR